MNAFQDAFISYGRPDSKAFVLRLHQRLIGAGLKVWVDQNDIPLGVDYQDQINEGIETSDNFIFVISPHAVNSPYCRREIELAVQLNKRIIPLMHVAQISRDIWMQRNPEKSETDWKAVQTAGKHYSDDRNPNLHPAIARINWVWFREDIDNFETSFAGLLGIFQRHQNYVQQHTRLMAQAREWEREQRQPHYLLVGEERLQAEAWLRQRFRDGPPPCEPTDLHSEFICESTKNANNLMTQVFLCSAEADRAVATQVGYSLMRQGFTLWTDQTDVQSGEELEDAVNRGIERADTMVYLLSHDSLASRQCQQEVDYAIAHNKRIIPLRLQATEKSSRSARRGMDDIFGLISNTKVPPPIPTKLQNVQAIDLTEPEDEGLYKLAINRLLKQLNQDASYFEQHKILLVRALKWQAQQRNPSVLLRGNNLKQTESWLQVAEKSEDYPPTALQKEFLTTSLEQPGDAAINVFLAYSSADSDFARRLNEAIQSQGRTTWFDQESLAVGVRHDVKAEIQRAIESAEVMLILLSPATVGDRACLEQLDYAVSLNKRVLPLHCRTVAPDHLPPTLKDGQWIDFRKRDGFFMSFGELMRSLDADPQHVRNHTRLLTKAIDWDRTGREESYLLRGKDLLQAQEWLQQAKGKSPAPIPLQVEYITASQEQPRRRVRLRTTALAALTIVGLLGVARLGGWMQPAELATYDHLLRLAPHEPQDDRLLIVEVDQDSTRFLNNRYAPSPGSIPDAALLDVLTVLRQSPPRLIGLDLYRDFNATPELAAQLKQTNNLIVVCKSGYINRRGEKIPGTPPPAEINAAQVGFSDFIEESDGGKFIRRHYLMQNPDPQYCNTSDAFSLVLARRYLETAGKSFVSPLNEFGEYVQDMELGDRPIPQLLGSGGPYQNRNNQLFGYQTLLKYRIHNGSPNQFAPTVSLAALLQNQVPPEQWRDRIVLIGITDRDRARVDFWNTPYGDMAGVKLQGQMVSQLLSATLNNRPLIRWWTAWGEGLWIFVWTLTGGLIVWYFRRLPLMAIALLVALISLYGLCYGLFVGASLWVPLVPGAIGLLTAAGVVGLLTARLRKV